jgi:hypothetical protein
MALLIHHQICWIDNKQSRISTYVKEGYIKLLIGVPAPIEDDVYDDKPCSNKEPQPLAEYTVSRVPNSEYLTMIQTYAASEGQMGASTWCNPGGTWLDYDKALHGNTDRERDQRTHYLVLNLHQMLKKTEKALVVADNAEKLIHSIINK